MSLSEHTEFREHLTALGLLAVPELTDNQRHRYL